MEYVELSRRLKHIMPCPLCGGILFTFEIEQLDLSNILPNVMHPIRKLRNDVKHGATLEDLIEQYELVVEKMEFSVCEKCGEHD